MIFLFTTLSRKPSFWLMALFLLFSMDTAGQGYLRQYGGVGDEGSPFGQWGQAVAPTPDGGNMVVDELEDLARQRVCALFGADHANVQPHAGAIANIKPKSGKLSNVTQATDCQ